MTSIPDDYRRIREARVEGIVAKHIAAGGPVCEWLFEAAFPHKRFLAVERIRLHVDRDHRQASGDPLAFGETDIEVVARLRTGSPGEVSAGLLIEMKVDARQAEHQGLRYAARASYRKKEGYWAEFCCMLVAPRKYLDGAYPSSDHRESGWHCVIALEDIAKQLASAAHGAQDSVVLLQSTEATNSWNAPIPQAVQFWDALPRFQRAVFPDVPIFINRQQGAGIFVWPSFFENQLAKNPREIRRKRIQIVHSGKTHVSLFVKNVKAELFFAAVAPLVDARVKLGPAGGAWQSVRVNVPYVDPQMPLSAQVDQLKAVFEAARSLYDFFVEHEQVLLGLPTFK